MKDQLTEEHKDILQAWFDAWVEGDLALSGATCYQNVLEFAESLGIETDNFQKILKLWESK